ncbi:MAG: hypothetical protein DHS20C16_12840 [Phycisphaerae bacterium]|nr:MAG: hypothetical protein DHS20C16_12840 [Phycisphaerae bacterium]
MFKWESEPSATRYRLWVYDDSHDPYSEVVPQSAVANGIIEHEANRTFSPNTTYTWWVSVIEEVGPCNLIQVTRGEDWQFTTGSEDACTDADPLLITPVAVSPPDDGEASDGTVYPNINAGMGTFSWSGNAQRYDVFLAEQSEVLEENEIATNIQGSQGITNLPVGVPLNRNTCYKWKVRGRVERCDGVWETVDGPTWYFCTNDVCEIQPPLNPNLNYPADGLVITDDTFDHEITLSWIGATHATSYAVWLGETASGGATELIAATANTHFAPQDLEGDTEYSWKVVALNESCDQIPPLENESPVWTFTTPECNPPPPVELLSPFNGEEGLPTQPIRLEWNVSDRADEYQVEVHRETGLVGKWTVESSGASVGTVFFEHHLANELEGLTEFTWHVDVVEYTICGRRFSRSEDWTFKTDDGTLCEQDLLETPYMPSPPDDISDPSLDPIDAGQIELSWSGEAQRYHVFFGIEGGLQENVTLQGTDLQSVTVGAERNKTYTWQVIAKTSECGGDDLDELEGPIWRFHTNNNCPTQEAPEAPLLVSPSDPEPIKGPTSDSPLTLSWNECDRAKWYEIHFGAADQPLSLLTTTTLTYHDLTSLTVGADYNWQIVAVNGFCDTVNPPKTAGPIWSFAICAADPIIKPVHPDPDSPSSNVPLDFRLSWVGDPDYVDFYLSYEDQTDHSGLSEQEIPVVAIGPPGPDGQRFEWDRTGQKWNNGREYVWSIKTTKMDVCGGVVHTIQGISEDWRFTTTSDCSGWPVQPAAPLLVYPEQSSDIHSIGNSVTLRWSHDGMASDLYFGLPGEEVAVVTGIPNHGDDVEVVYTVADLGEDTYSWFVRSTNECGGTNLSSDSATQTFTIVGCNDPELPIAAKEPTTPHNGASGVTPSSTAVLSWAHGDPAMPPPYYVVNLNKIDGPEEGPFIVPSSPSSPQNSVTVALDPDEHYKWQVRALSVSCFDTVLTTASIPWYFSTCSALPSDLLRDPSPYDRQSAVYFDPTTTLKWGVYPGYEILSARMEFGESGGGLTTQGSIGLDCEDNVCSWTTPVEQPLALDTEYEWRVTLTVLDSCNIPVTVVGDLWRFRTVADCNLNGEPDTWDVATGFSLDDDGDLIPDECKACDTSITFTTDEDFNNNGQAVLSNVTQEVSGQLQLEHSDTQSIIWVAASGRGTIIKIDALSGQVLGEYLSAPDGRGRSPSRTAVDSDGAVWAGNIEEGTLQLLPSAVVAGTEYGGSVVKIAHPYTGGCVSRDGDPAIRTSTGLGDVLPWSNGSDVDDDGGVSTAVDECIVEYIRTDVKFVHGLALKDDAHLWVNGWPVDGLQQINLQADPPILELMMEPGCGGYAGIFAASGAYWATGGSGTQAWSQSSDSLVYPPACPRDGFDVLRDITTDPGSPDFICIDPETDPNPIYRSSHGIAAGAGGWIWVTDYCSNYVRKIPSNGVVGPETERFYVGDNRGPFGIAIHPSDDHVWIALETSNTVLRMDNLGAIVKEIPLTLAGFPDGDSPNGIAVDEAGKVWVTNRDSGNVMRIDPTAGSDSLGAVDLVVDLSCPGCEDAGPVNLGGMSGVVGQTLSQVGTWSTVFDRKIPGMKWISAAWNTEDCVVDPTPPGAILKVEIRAADTQEDLELAEYLEIANGAAIPADPGVVGRFVQVLVSFTSQPGSPSPVLCDLTLEQEYPHSAYFPMEFSAAITVNNGAIKTVVGDFEETLLVTGEPLTAAAYAFATEVFSLGGNNYDCEILRNELQAYLDAKGYIGRVDLAFSRGQVALSFTGIGPPTGLAIEAGILLDDRSALLHYAECDDTDPLVYQLIHSANNGGPNPDGPPKQIFDVQIARECISTGVIDKPLVNCQNDRDCDDGYVCTLDVCNSNNGCHQLETICDDNDACTIDSCDPYSGGCVHEPTSCDDGNLCTIDSCHFDDGCSNTPISCDDGNACTDDTCDDGNCIYTETVCGEGAEFCDGKWECNSESGCYNAGDPCEDSQFQYCSPTLQRCVECLSNDHCGDELTAQCNIATGLCFVDDNCPTNEWDENGVCQSGSLELTSATGSTIQVAHGTGFDITLEFFNQSDASISLGGVTAFVQATTANGLSTETIDGIEITWVASDWWTDVFDNQFPWGDDTINGALVVDDSSSQLIAGAVKPPTEPDPPPLELTIAPGGSANIATIHMIAPTIPGNYELSFVSNAYRRTTASDESGLPIGVKASVASITVEVQP